MSIVQALYFLWQHFINLCILRTGLPWWPGGEESACQCKRCRFDPWLRKSPWRRKWQPTPVFLPGKSYGQRILESYSPWGCKRVGHNLATEQQQQALLPQNRRSPLFFIWDYSVSPSLARKPIFLKVWSTELFHQNYLQTLDQSYWVSFRRWDIQLWILNKLPE